VPTCLAEEKENEKRYLRTSVRKNSEETGIRRNKTAPGFYVKMFYVNGLGLYFYA